MREEYKVLIPCHIDGIERVPGDQVWLYPAQATYLITGGFVAKSIESEQMDAE